MTFTQARELYLNEWLKRENNACSLDDVPLYENYLREPLSHLSSYEDRPYTDNPLVLIGNLSAQTKKHAPGLIRRTYIRK